MKCRRTFHRFLRVPGQCTLPFNTQVNFQVNIQVNIQINIQVNIQVTIQVNCDGLTRPQRPLRPSALPCRPNGNQFTILLINSTTIIPFSRASKIELLQIQTKNQMLFVYHVLEPLQSPSPKVFLSRVVASASSLVPTSQTS